SFWLQRLVWTLLKKKNGFPDEYLVRCLSAFLKAGNWTSRYRRVNATYRAILKELRQPYGTEYLTSDEFNLEVALVAEELEEFYSLNARGHGPTLPDE